LLHAGLALVRILGRDGVPVEGIALNRYEFGLRSRYLRRRTLAAGDDDVLEALRHAAAGGERPVLFVERDENVDTVLRRWDEVHALADVPLPDDPEAVRRLRRKDLLPEVAADAGVPSPYTVRAESPEAIRDAHLKPPLLLKPLEGQEFAQAFGEKAFVAETIDEAVAGWKRASFARSSRTVVAEDLSVGVERSASTRTGGSTVTVSATPRWRALSTAATNGMATGCVESAPALSAATSGCPGEA